MLLDVDAAALRTSIAALRARRPGIAARGVAGDFLRDLRWLGPRRGRRLMAFLGGTIGNIEPVARPVLPVLGGGGARSRATRSSSASTW